jgi:hypothetical protein
MPFLHAIGDELSSRLRQKDADPVYELPAFHDMWHQ